MFSEEELKKMRNYLIQATKWIESTNGKHYRIPTVLQIFVDGSGVPKLLREV